MGSAPTPPTAHAVARLYAAKGRPSFNPLIAHVAELAAARRLARFDATATQLAQAFWPGPLTLVLPKTPDCPVSDLATAGLDSIAVRVPDHPVARALIAAFGKPIVAPSANRSGHVSPTTAAHVLADLRGQIDLVVDGGPTKRWGGIHHRRLPGRADAAAPGRAGARGRHEAARTSAGGSAADGNGGRERSAARARACWPRITRQRRGCGSRPPPLSADEALLAFGPARGTFRRACSTCLCAAI